MSEALSEKCPSEEREMQDTSRTQGEPHREEHESVLAMGEKEQREAGEAESCNEKDDDEGYDDTDYTPDFVFEILEDPPILPGESKDAFGCLFESFEFGNGDHRPKRDLEYLWLTQAVIAAWEVMRYDRMKVAIVANERHPAVETLHRRYAAAPSTTEEAKGIGKSAQCGAIKYFTDESYRKEFAEKLARAGFASGAVEGAAFLRALPSLSTIDRLIRSAEKRMTDCLKRLEAAYASRSPEDPLPRSSAVGRRERLQERGLTEARARVGNDG